MMHIPPDQPPLTEKAESEMNVLRNERIRNLHDQFLNVPQLRCC